MKVSPALPPVIVSLPDPSEKVAGIHPFTRAVSLPSSVDIEMEVTPKSWQLALEAVTAEQPAPGVTGRPPVSLTLIALNPVVTVTLFASPGAAL
jgi:hypothetical protein